MTKRPTRPARMLARTYLQRMLANAAAHGRSRIPALRELAAAAGVCYVTMQRAAHEAACEGLLFSAPGRGMHAQGIDTPRQLPARPRQEQLAEAFMQDVRRARYAPGELLPAVKSLCYQYQASATLIRRMLHDLASQELLERIGHRYRICTYRIVPRHNRIILITRGDRTGYPARTNAWTTANLHALESHCSQSGIVLDIVLCDFLSGALTPMADRRARTDPLQDWDGVLGYCVWPSSLAQPVIDAILRRLHGSGLPVCMLIEQHDTASPPPAVPLHLLTMTTGHIAGKAVGRYLSDLGHRCIAYISHEPHSDWSCSRFAGLRDGLAPDCRLLECSTAAHDESDDADTAMARSMLLLEQAARAAPFNAVRRQSAYQSAANIYSSTLYSQLIANRLKSVFQNALAHPASPSAWVCCNDIAAIEALAYLRRNQVRVPSEISVAGFDNSEEALLQQLTSYDFNSRGLAQAQVGCLLDWPLLRKPHARGTATTVEIIEGTVIPRASSGAALVSMMRIAD